MTRRIRTSEWASLDGMLDGEVVGGKAERWRLHGNARPSAVAPLTSTDVLVLRPLCRRPLPDQGLVPEQFRRWRKQPRTRNARSVKPTLRAGGRSTSSEQAITKFLVDKAPRIVLHLFLLILMFGATPMSEPMPPLVDPVTAHRLRHTLAQALRGGCTLGEAKGEARGYLKAISPALPQAQVAEVISQLFSELDLLLDDLIHCEPDARAEPPGQLRLEL
jgi:hypothetical protein